MLELVCGNCGRESAPDAAFCAGCGNRLASPIGDANGAAGPPSRFAGQRRVVTIVMSDLSGYTAMCEQCDPETVSEIMGTIKRDGTAIIESFGGMVNQFKGDEIIALFGLPTARGNDPQRAVAAALAIHQRVAELNSVLTPPPPVPLEMHSGVHTGLLIVETNDARDGVYGLTGDAINTASRLLGVAGRGELVIGRPTRDAVEAYFEIEDAGLHAVRNKAEPLAAFRVVGEHANVTRFDAARERGLTRFVGRDAEVQQLLDALASATSGDGRITVIEAEAGLGKSRVCFEFSDRARSLDADLSIVKGRCQTFGSTSSYLPFVQVIREILQVAPDSTLANAAAQVGATTAAIDPDLVRFVPAYLHLLSMIDVKDLPPEFRGVDLPDLLQQAIVELVVATARDRKITIQLDDWHWADEASHATLTRLAQVVGGAPLLVVVTQRPGAPTPEVADRIMLEALPISITSAMIAGYFDASSIPTDLEAAVYERTNGNPLFVEEICASLRNGGHVDVVDRRLVVDNLDDVAIPDTVQAVVLSRIDVLEPGPRDVLRMASVIGREFSTDVLAAAVDDTTVDAHVEMLRESGFIEPVPNFAHTSDDRLRFRHVITREVTYDTLLVRERKQAHARVAEIIEAGQTPTEIAQRGLVDVLARHHQLGGNSRAAIEYYEMAGSLASARRELADARHNLSEAIAESYKLEPSADNRTHRRRVALQWASACIFLPSKEQITVLEKIQGEALEDGDPAAAVLANYWIQWIRYSIGDQRAAEEGTRRLLAQVEAAGNESTTSLLQCHLGQILTVQGRYAEAEDLLRTGLKRSPQSRATQQDPSERVSGLYCYSLAQLAVVNAARGAFDEAATLTREAMDLVRSSGERATEASLGICAALCAIQGRNWAEARRCIDDISLLPTAATSPYVSMYATCISGYATFRLGDRDEGLRELRRGVALHEHSEAHLSLSRTRAWLADALFRSGELDEAATVAESALERNDVLDNTGIELASCVLLQLAGLSGAELTSRIEQLAASAVISASPPAQVDLDLAAANAHLAVGEHDEAIARAERALATLESLGCLATAMQEGRDLIEEARLRVLR